MLETGLHEAEAVSSILAVLRDRTGADFSRYRPATVERRIVNRMISVGARTFDAYLAVLRDSRDEARHLLDRIAIKVSRFYRNRAAFDVLRFQVLPELAARARGIPLRVWCAGCGYGEEPYTVAMLLHEAGVRGTVEATDVDPAAIEAAQRGRYPDTAAAELPPELAQRYLATVDEAGRRLLTPVPEVRARVRFTHLDLLTGKPPSAGGFDLVCCRNVLIYLQGGSRDEVFATLQRALFPGAFLFLGEAEWPSEPLAASLESLGHGVRIFRVKRASDEERN